MYCFHNNLLPPLFVNLFLTNSQIHSYSTRTANYYRVHYCRTNLKKFTIDSLPRCKHLEFPSCKRVCFLLQSLLCQVFLTLRKTARVFSKLITELAKPHTCGTIYVNILLCTMWPQLKACWFLEVISPYIVLNINC